MPPCFLSHTLSLRDSMEFLSLGNPKNRFYHWEMQFSLEGELMISFSVEIPPSFWCLCVLLLRASATGWPTLEAEEKEPVREKGAALECHKYFRAFVRWIYTKFFIMMTTSHHTASGVMKHVEWLTLLSKLNLNIESIYRYVNRLWNRNKRNLSAQQQPEKLTLMNP